MIPKKEPNTPPNGVIADFLSEYSPLLELAMEASVASKTADQMMRYRRREKRLYDFRQQALGQLELFISQVRESGIIDTGEFGNYERFQEAKKSLNQVIDDQAIFLAFRNEIEESVKACHKCIEKWQNKASDLARNQPLQFRNLDLEMLSAIETLAKPTFNPSTGVIEIVQHDESGTPRKPKPLSKVEDFFNEAEKLVQSELGGMTGTGMTTLPHVSESKSAKNSKKK